MRIVSDMIQGLYPKIFRRDLANPSSSLATNAASPASWRWDIDESLQNYLETTARLSSDQLASYRQMCIDRNQPPTQIYEYVADQLFRYAEPELSSFFYQRFLEHHPRRDLHSRYLITIYLSPATDNTRLFAAAVDYHRQYYKDVRPIAEPLVNTPDPDRKIRLGLICGFFANTVSRGLLLPFLSALDRAKLEIILYDNGDPEAGKTIAGKAADLWRHTRDLEDRELAQLIRRDQVDVLIELNGHLPDVRYGAMALRAAPVQINWYNWHATSGLPFIDYALAHPIMVPPEDAPYYVEKLIHLPRAAGTFSVPQEAPEPAPPPFHRTGRITVGCFGASHKLNDAVFDVWARLLQQNPHFDLLLKNAALDEAGFQERVRRFFHSRDIRSSRLILRGFSDYATMLGEYADVDIALDTWPHNGGATTYEAMCQGVPVVTWKGERPNSRAGLFLLSGVGLADLVADSPRSLIEIVERLAADKGRLDVLRAQLRHRLLSSNFGNMNAWNDDFQHALRSAWKAWCAAQAGSPAARP